MALSRPDALNACGAGRRPPPLLFDYGTSGPGAERLALFGGSLILDGGEADQSFLLRCQDRFVGYAWLLGMRPILLVEDAAHADRYTDALARMRTALARLGAATGLATLRHVSTPLVFRCDPSDAAIAAHGPLPALAAQASFGLNQISPTAAALLAGIDRQLARAGVRTGLDAARCATDGAIALQFHDKRAAGRIAGTVASAPPMLAEVPITPSALAALADWPALLDHYRAVTGEPAATLVIKSTGDSAGNLNAIFAPDTFAAARARLLADVTAALGSEDDTAALSAIRTDIAASHLDPRLYPDSRLRSFERRRRRRRKALDLTIQRYVPPATGTPVRPAAIGLSFHLGGNMVRTIAVAGQTYHDRERRQFRGALLDARMEADFRGSPFEGEMHALCRAFRKAGHRGPIGFDALLDQSGRYVLIGDCNPRLSAVLPPLALRAGLRRAGISAQRVLNLGYRGDYLIPDLAQGLAALDTAGLLFTRSRRSGILPLPNLARPGGYDLFLIDAPYALLDTAAAALAAAGCVTPLSSAIPGLPSAE